MNSPRPSAEPEAAETTPQATDSTSNPQRIMTPLERRDDALAQHVHAVIHGDDTRQNQTRQDVVAAEKEAILAQVQSGDGMSTKINKTLERLCTRRGEYETFQFYIVEEAQQAIVAELIDKRAEVKELQEIIDALKHRIGSFEATELFMQTVRSSQQQEASDAEPS